MTFKTSILIVLCLWTVTLSAQDITFNEHIAPIIFENCTVCHHPEGSGPFTLNDYASVSKRSLQVAEVTQSTFMPPWKPDSGYGPALEGERRLSNQEIEHIQAWHLAGSPEGATPLSVKRPKFTDHWQLGEPDLVISPDSPFMLPAEGSDVFRNLVIPIPVTTTRYVRAVEFKPKNLRVVHHSSMMVDRTVSSLQKDRAEAGVGFDGMEANDAANPDGYFIGWTPGQRPYEAYPGTAWQLDPNSYLVVQMHLIPSGKPEEVQPSIGLYFSEEPPEKQAFVLLIKSQSIDIPAGESDYLIEEQFKTPVPISILRAYPHAHYLGKDLQVFAELPTGEQTGIIRISEWDFNWQGDYRLIEPLRLPAGSTMIMRYVYDNSAENIRNPNSPPQRVSYGWNSTDEMGEISLQILTQNRTDLLSLQSEYFKYKLIGDPSNPYTHNSLGYSLSQQGDKQAAAKHYLKTLTIKPDLAPAHNNLGVIFSELNDLEKAHFHLNRAVQIIPDYAEAYHNHGTIYLENRQAQEARDHFQKALTLRPELNPTRLSLAKSEMALRNFEAVIHHLEILRTSHFELEDTLVLLAGAYLFSGDKGRATTTYQDLLEFDPSNRDALYGLGLLSQEQKKFSQAQTYFQRLLENHPTEFRAAIQLGRSALYSNRAHEALNSFRKALVISLNSEADISVILLSLKSPTELELFAIACVQESQIETARQAIQKAIELAKRQNNQPLGELIEKRFSELIKTSP